ncbi:DUF7305 domain-containing protein [Cerasicoccus frondis]|uniref:DUF7305 domain-containing protein n=1 Tax=Cerasicoccus frondis TaxID=490090 RepID=UPI0028524F18|nr:hypothetical protein [Cerasicoccus frondis]
MPSLSLKPPCHNQHRGSVVIAVLIMAIMVVTTVSLYLRNAVQEMKYAERTFALQQSINLAEMGAEDAFLAINTDNWSGWSELAHDCFYRNYSTEHSGEQIYVYVDRTDHSDIWMTAGSEIDVTGNSVEKQIYIRLGYRSLFQNGLTAKNNIIMNGNQIKVDSYNSDKGQYHHTNNRNDNGSVASRSVEVDSVVVQNADIFGYVATGGSEPKVGSQGSITGFDTPNGVQIDSNRVSTDFYADLPDVTMPVNTGVMTSLSSYFLGSSGSSTNYLLNGLNIKNNTALYVLGQVGLVIDTDITIGGDLIVFPGAKLTLYLKGDANISGLGIVNLSGKPENLVIYGTATQDKGQTIRLSGAAAMAAVIYAPNAEMELKGGGNNKGVFYGAVVAKNISIKGNYDFHYDEALKDFSPDKTYQMLEWRELSAAKDRYPLKFPDSLVSYKQ